MSPIKHVIASVATTAFIVTVTYQLCFGPPDTTFAGPKFEPLLQELSSAETMVRGAVVTGMGFAATVGRNAPVATSQEHSAVAVYQARDDVRCQVVLGFANTREKQCRRNTGAVMAEIQE